MYPGSLSPQVGCERFESRILVKVVCVRLQVANIVLLHRIGAPYILAE